MIRALGALIAVLFLSGCGGAAGAIARLAIDPPNRQQPTRPTFPAPTIDQGAKQAPVYPISSRILGFEGWTIGTGLASLAYKPGPPQNNASVVSCK